MDLELRVERLEAIVLNQAQTSGWVKPSIAGQLLGISPRRLVQMYDNGELHKACAKQINSSTQRRRLLFDLELVQKSMGRPVLAKRSEVGFMMITSSSPLFASGSIISLKGQSLRSKSRRMNLRPYFTAFLCA